jgi:NitT/TauT family transport system substrate-binding protein
MHRLFSLAALCLLLMGPAASLGAAPLKIIMAGLPVYETYPMLAMAESHCLNDVCAGLEFTPWNNPDQMRALMAGGQAHFMVMPSNVAIKLRANGIKVKLALVSLSSTLWIVSNDGKVSSLQELKGREIAIPFRGDMPEIIFSRVASGLGMDPRRDFKLRYMPTPMDALQQLLIGRVGYAFLAEPVISSAIHRLEKAPPGKSVMRITRAVDMQKEWRKVYPHGPGMMLGAIAVNPEMSRRPEMVERFIEEYQKALQWCRDNPLQTGRLVERRFPFLNAQAVAKSIATMEFKAARADEVKEQLKRFLEITAQNNGKEATAPLSVEDLCWQGR